MSFPPPHLGESSTRRSWYKRPLSQMAVQHFSEKYSVDPLLATILLRRGISRDQEVLYFIERGLEYLHNPFQLNQISFAVSRCWQAIQRQEKVAILGDTDVDGITSTVLLVEGLGELGLPVLWNADSAGLSRERLEWAQQQGASLIFVLDCGGNSAQEVALARDRQQDVIILDHHLPSPLHPQANALVNPYLNGYPFPQISTAVVVGKFLWAMGFFQHPHYNQPLALLHFSRDQQQQLWISYALVTNLVEQERQHLPLSLDLAPQILRQLQAQPILWFEEQQQRPLADEAFGFAQLSAEDLAPAFRAATPHLASHSLSQLHLPLHMKEHSPLDTLLQLYRAHTFHANPLGRHLLQRGLDLMALSTLADMMPLHNENRLIVHHGLQAINQRLRPGLRELLLTIGENSSPFYAEGLSRQIIPLLNAAGRMGKPAVAIQLFLAPQAEQRLQYAQQLQELNAQRRQLSQQYWRLLLPEAKKTLPLFNNKMVVCKSASMPRGITGLIAARLSRLLRLPVIVATTLPTQQISGSLRSLCNMPANLLLEGAADLYQDYGGHPSAGGFRLQEDRWPELLRRYRELAPQLQSAAAERWDVDLELDAQTLKPDLLERIIDAIAPFGPQNAPPLLLSREFEIIGMEAFGHKKSHVRLTLRLGEHLWTAIHWNTTLGQAGGLHVGKKIDLIYTLEHSYKPHRMQLVVQAMRPSSC